MRDTSSTALPTNVGQSCEVPGAPLAGELFFRHGSAVHRARFNRRSSDPCFEIAKPISAAITTGPAPRLLRSNRTESPSPAINEAPTGWLSMT